MRKVLGWAFTAVLWGLVAAMALFVLAVLIGFLTPVQPPPIHTPDPSATVGR